MWKIYGLYYILQRLMINSLRNQFFKSAFWASIQYIPPSLGLAWKSSRWLCALIGLLTLMAAGLPIGIACLGKAIVDAIVQKNLSLTLLWVSTEATVVIIQAGIVRLLFLTQSILGAKLGADINILILEKAVSLELRHFENAEIYDSLSKARQQASIRPVAMVTDTMQLIQNSLTFMGYVGLLFAFNAWMVVALIAAAIPATISEMKFSNATFRMRNRRSPDNRRLNYLEYVLANDDHVKEVKVMGLSGLFLSRYQQLAYQFLKEDKDLSTQRTKWAYALSLLATLTFYGSYAAMATLAALSRITLGSLTLYVMAFRQGQQAFQSGLTAIGNMYESNLYMSNLFDFLAIQTLEDVLKEPSPFTENKTPLQSLETGFHFHQVGFKYEGTDHWVLRNITLTIPKGQSLALVGHNGAGKSTFIKLICRLYDPTEGYITLDGINLKDWPLNPLRKRIGAVFQDFNEYHLSVKENVGVGQVDQLNNEAQIHRAIERGGATEVIHDLADGLDSILGKWFHKGIDLSGGQWQKIALSRGFMREDADVLILDEPTAALDADAEQAVFERFRHLTKGKTSILISHRFPTVRMADHIVVLEKGSIIEQGNHATLLQKNGQYAHMFTLQAQGYQ